MASRRLIQSTRLVPTTPALGGGHPSTPKYNISYASNINVTQGVGHVRVFPDPDPVWNGTIWTTPPPSAPAGSHFIRWTARSLPDPATQGGEYLLGTRSTVDGTSGLPAGAASWAATPGSDDAIAWNSDYPFKPRVAPYVHRGYDGRVITTPIAVHFTPHHLQHMWGDFGTLLTMPFTFMMVCIITRFHGPRSKNFFLDAGRDPTATITAATRAAWFNHGVPGHVNLSENLGYRTGLQARPHQLLGFNDQTPTTRTARVPMTHNIRPKVIYGVYAGVNSVFGAFANEVRHPGEHVQRAVKLVSNGSQRFVVLGRGNGSIDPDRSSTMVVFEIRCWTGALTNSQLQDHHDQLVSTWRIMEHI